MINTYTFYLRFINPLNSELNPICHLLALLGAHHILHVSGLRVNTNILSSTAPILGRHETCLKLILQI
jgi:transposase